MTVDQQTHSPWRAVSESENDLSVDGVAPRFVAAPASVEEMGQVVARANEQGLGVIPRGSGTRMGLGCPPLAADLVLHTRGLNRVVEYQPADLTLTIEAGATLGEVQDLLRPEGQHLALDPPGGAGSTLGGIIATNASGPLRLAYGSARDLVIGTRVVNADGVATKAGGRVVKNVAGYDLNKLYIGSLGTVGVVVELSFKLWPIPPAEATLLASFDSAALGIALARLMQTPLNPLSLEALDAGAASASGVGDPGPGRWMLSVRFGGSARALARQLGDTERIFTEAGAIDLQRLEDAPLDLWRGIADQTRAQPDQVLVRLAVPFSRTVAALGTLERLAAEAGLSATLQGRAGSGVIYARLSAAGSWNDDALAAAAKLVQQGRAWALREVGSLVVESAPAALKSRVDVWGDVGASLKVMRALKDQLDPRGVLNRGRFVAGI